MFWIACLALMIAITAMVIAPLVRQQATTRDDDPQVAIYKAQLAEVDRDVAREVISADDAERARAEIARRLIAASKVQTTVRNTATARPAAIVMGAVLLLGSGGLYMLLGAPGYPDLPQATRIALGDEARANRPTQAAAEAAAPVVLPPEVPEDYRESVEQLRTIVPTRPDDLQGWELLAHHEAQLRNFAAAAKAQAQVIAIKGAEASVDDRVRHADLLITAANGFVSPEAEQVVRSILDIDPNNIPARYYLGALFDQTDRPDMAFQLWRPLVENNAPDTFHVAMARDQIAQTAMRAGLNYTPPTVSGPSLDDMRAAEDMDPEDRAAMIEGMVAGLSDRLATQGGSVAEWAQLITAYGALGQAETAREILAEARDVFGASEEAQAVLDEAEARAGLSE